LNWKKTQTEDSLGTKIGKQRARKRKGTNIASFSSKQGGEKESAVFGLSEKEPRGGGCRQEVVVVNGGEDMGTEEPMVWIALRELKGSGKQACSK